MYVCILLLYSNLNNADTGPVNVTEIIMTYMHIYSSQIAIYHVYGFNKTVTMYSYVYPVYIYVYSMYILVYKFLAISRMCIATAFSYAFE